MDMNQDALDKLGEKVTELFHTERALDKDKELQAYGIQEWTNKHGDSRLSIHFYVKSDDDDDK